MCADFSSFPFLNISYFPRRYDRVVDPEDRRIAFERFLPPSLPCTPFPFLSSFSLSIFAHPSISCTLVYYSSNCIYLLPHPHTTSTDISETSMQRRERTSSPSSKKRPHSPMLSAAQSTKRTCSCFCWIGGGTGWHAWRRRGGRHLWSMCELFLTQYLPCRRILMIEGGRESASSLHWRRE